MPKYIKRIMTKIVFFIAPGLRDNFFRQNNSERDMIKTFFNKILLTETGSGEA